MQEVLYIETVAQANVLLKPLRVELLRRMDRPRSCTELAGLFKKTPQQIYYHVKALEKAGLAEKVSERRVRGMVEGLYQARARAYWMAPHLVGRLGGRRAAQDQTSLRFLLSLAEEIHDDIGRLAQHVGRDIPSLGAALQIHLPDGARRAEFLRDVEQALKGLAERYGVAEGAPLAPGESFRLVLACYPKEEGSL